MKVVEFIRRLEEIGFDENTKLSFSCVDGNTGGYYELEPDDDNDQEPFCYGEKLTGEPYNNDVIDFCLNVDECEDYIKSKKYFDLEELTGMLINVINEFENGVRH